MYRLRWLQGRKEPKDLAVLGGIAVMLAALTIGLVRLGSLGTDIGGAVSGVASLVTIVQAGMNARASLRRGPSGPAPEAPLPPARWQGIPSADGLSARDGEHREAVRQLAVARVTALTGPGGFGKTDLAKLLCADGEVRKLFPGKGQWFGLGPGARDREIAEKISSALPGSRELYTDAAAAAQAYARQLAGADRMLLVLDDVRDGAQLAPFLLQDAPWTLLVTTRSPGLLPDAASQVTVGPLTMETAAQILAHDLPQVSYAHRQAFFELSGGCAKLIELIRACLLRDGAAQAGMLVAELRQKGLTTVAGRPELAEAVPLASGLDALDPAGQDRFAELGIFPPGSPVPVTVLAMLWGATAGLDPGEVPELAGQLAAAGLLTLARDRDQVTLDPVVREFAAVRLGQRTRDVQTGMLGAARGLVPPLPGGNAAWWELPGTAGYWWQHLCWHLREAGRLEELACTCCDLRFVIRKLMQPSGPDGLAADLAAAGTPEALRLRAAVIRHARLLSFCPDDLQAAYPGVVTSLLGGVNDLAAQTGAVRAHLSAWTCPPASGSRPDPVVMLLGAGSVFRPAEVAVSPDGTWLAAAADDGIRVWNADGTERARIDMYRSPLGHGPFDLVISSDSTWLAVIDGQTVRAWDADGSERRIPAASAQEPTALAVSPDGAWTATGHADGSVQLWQSEDTPPRLLPGGGSAVTALRAARGALAAAHQDGTIRIQKTSGRTRTIKNPGDGARGFAFSPDGTWLAVGDSETALRIWDAKGRQRCTLDTGASVTAAQISQDGGCLATGHADGAIRFWDRSGAGTGLLRGDRVPVLQIALNPAAPRAAVAVGDGGVQIWDTTSAWQERPTRYAVDSDRVDDVALSPDGTWIVTGDDQGSVQIREPDGTPRRRVLDWMPAQAVAVRPDGRQIIVGVMDGRLVFFSADGSKQAEIICSPHDGIHSVAISPDGSWIAAGHHSGTIRIFDADGHEQASFPGMVGYPRALGAIAISPDGTWLAAGGEDGVRTWTPAGREHAPLADPPRGALSVAISPDGTWLAAGSREGVRVWTADGRERFRQDKPRPVYAVAISPDGNKLAVGATDTNPFSPSSSGTVRIVAPDGTPLTELRTERDVLACAWFPDSADLCVAGGSGIQRFTVQPPC